MNASSTPRPAPIQFRDRDLEPQLDARAAHGNGRGGVASRDLARYYELLRRSLPTFTREEAGAICDACNGTLWEPWSMSLLWADVADCEGLGEKWGIDQAALVARLRGLTYPELVATADAVERFWTSSGTYAISDTDDALVACGLVAAAPQES